MIINRSTLDTILAKFGIPGSSSASASVVAVRDANANLLADAFIPGVASTVTAAGALTLTADSKQVQILTGTSTHVVNLPTTGIAAGTPFTIINLSTGAVNVYSSGGNLVRALWAGTTTTVVANTATPTTAAHWTVLGHPAETNAFVNTLVLRDGSGVIRYSNAAPGGTTVATTGGTTTLSYGLSRIYVFTGTNTHTVTLPTTGITVGVEHVIINLSTGTLTVNSSAGNLVASLTTGQSAQVVANTATPTTAAHWTVLNP